MSNYYAVRSGRVPGIYNSWDACNEQVHKFTGAIFKKFKNLGDAEAFVRNVNSGRSSDGVLGHLNQGREAMSSILSAAANGGSFTNSFSSTRGAPSLFASTSTEQAFATAQPPPSRSSSSSSSHHLFHPRASSGIPHFFTDARNVATHAGPGQMRSMYTASESSSVAPSNHGATSDGRVHEYSNDELNTPMSQDTLVIYVDGGCDGTAYLIAIL